MYIKYKHKRNTRRHYYVRFQLVNDSIAPKFLQGSGRSQTIILRRYIVPSGKLQDQHTHTRARARARTHTHARTIHMAVIQRVVRIFTLFHRTFIYSYRKKNKLTSSVYDCTVEDVEYIYNKLSI